MIDDLSPCLQKPANEIDAAIFSGDEFLDKVKRENMEKILARWTRGLEELARVAAIIEEEEKNEKI